jgi:[acyl-carrier-protein] S-malonyltransferase
MALDWVEAYEVVRETFEEADDVLGLPLSRICWEGPEDELQLTENTQPAILTTSIAIYRAVSELLDPPLVMAGHSLGEYSALVASGCLAFDDALRLVKSRGRFMQEAVPAGKGAMAAIIGLDAVAVEQIAEAVSAPDEVCAVANFNAPSQIVVAGLLPAVERAVERATAEGARRAVLLPVSAPFHSPLMAPARERLETLLAEVEFRTPDVPIVANIDAQPETDGETARKNLVRQVDAPVRWVESVEQMVMQFAIDTAIEIGPGKVLSGLARRIEPSLSAVSLAEPGRLDALTAKE